MTTGKNTVLSLQLWRAGTRSTRMYQRSRSAGRSRSRSTQRWMTRTRTPVRRHRPLQRPLHVRTSMTNLRCHCRCHRRRHRLWKLGPKHSQRRSRPAAGGSSNLRKHQVRRAYHHGGFALLLMKIVLAIACAVALCRYRLADGQHQDVLCKHVRSRPLPVLHAHTFLQQPAFERCLFQLWCISQPCTALTDCDCCSASR